MLHVVGSYQIIIMPFIVIVFVVIKPDFCKSDGILLKNIGASTPCVRASRSKDVSNVRAQHLL